VHLLGTGFVRWCWLVVLVVLVLFVQLEQNLEFSFNIHFFGEATGPPNRTKQRHNWGLPIPGQFSAMLPAATDNTRHQTPLVF
jgi:hypothetical protein